MRSSTADRIGLTIRHRCAWACGFLMLALGWAGCDGPGGGGGVQRTLAPGDLASRRLPDATLAEIRPVADRVFRQHFRLDRGASSANQWVSEPTEVTENVGGERVRDVLGTPNRVRQTAVLRITQEGKTVLAQCQVRRERLDTAERAAFARERGDDRPTDTPIDRRGASSPESREEWTPIGRDRNAESLILDAILEHLGGSASPPAP